jgi:hypothetical protein
MSSKEKSVRYINLNLKKILVLFNSEYRRLSGIFFYNRPALER